MAPISGKDIIPKESINTQKVTNAPNLISQSEPSEPKVIMLDNKMWNTVVLFSVGTVDSVTSDKFIPVNKRNMKSPAMSPLRMYPIPNQDINRLITEKDQSLPLHLAKFPPEFKSLINEAHDHNSTEDYCNDSTDNPRNDKEDPVNNLKAINNKDIDDKYKYEN